MAFVQGWHPDFAAAADADLRASGRYYTVAAPAKPRRPAVSLSQYRLNYYLQGATGSCWVHSPKQMGEVMGKQLGYNVFPFCRRLIGYAAKQMYEQGGNPGNGGSPTDAVRAMTADGVGLAHEDLAPYPVYNDEQMMLDALAVRPPQDVYDDALKSHIIASVVVQSLSQITTLIDGNKPVANGFQCPAEIQDSDTFLSSLSGQMVGPPGQSGHSMLIWGYADAGVFDQYSWLELEGWWGKLYRTLPPSLAKLVPGYVPVTPTMTTSKWVRTDMYVRICNFPGGSEHISATDLDGIAKGIVEAPLGFNPLMV